MRNSQQATSVFGIYFCPRCSNIMSPARANGSLLEFSCQTCGSQEIDFALRFNEDCLLYTKELQKHAKKHVSDHTNIFDPAMLTVEARCPECGHDQAVYEIAPDENETRLVTRMTCAAKTGLASRCGHSWELREEEHLFEDCVVHQDDLQ